MDRSQRKTEFPLPSMPRMGRRNAIAFPNSGVFSDDDGAFSPINLLQRASVSDIDPEGAIAQELKLQKQSPSNQSQSQYEQKLKAAAAPLASVLDSWKKLHEAKSKGFNGIERLFDPPGSLMTSMSAIASTKPKTISRNDNLDGPENRAGQQRHNPIVPWRKQDTRPATTMAEERRKLFESFDMTSIDPPETPQVSELTLLKMAKKNRRRRRDNEYSSHESFPSPFITKFKESSKLLYANVQPKVNTRWDKVDEQVKNENVASYEKPSGSNRTKNGTKPLVALPAKRQASNTENITRLVTNYPASETVKNTTDRLPLTIAPRYNHKKAMGLISETRPSRKTADTLNDASSTRLFGVIPAHQKTKYEKQQSSHAPAGNSLKSTFFNLQRINNGAASKIVNKKASSTAELVVSRYSANILGTPVIKSNKKTVPIVTTIQSPPSPFLASKISIQSQMNEIPINGEVLKGAASSSRGGAKNIAKPKPGKAMPVKTNNGNKKNNTATTGQLAKSNAAPFNTKVVPTLGTVPNKYNNIYIGPYSGSESEGEHNSARKR